MALPNSPNSISFSQIESEFGQNSKRSLDLYRVNDNYVHIGGGELQNLPLDDGIPQSGTIRFSDFHGKRLNMVVNYYDGHQHQRAKAKQKFINNYPGEVRCVGGYIDQSNRPQNTSGKKVIIHINDVVYSNKNANDINNRLRCAFRTGSWKAGTTLQIDIGSDAKILGAGGDGGDGAYNQTVNGQDGFNGNSAIGLKYGPVTMNISSSAIIAGGGGGGGGGGGAYDTDKNDDELASGGGGGGGAGMPAGLGGEGPDNWEDESSAYGEDGDDGTEQAGGAGGDGGNQGNEAIGGDGGDGADLGGDGNSGGGGSGETRSGGGSGGNSGYWLVTGGNSYTSNLTSGPNLAGGISNSQPI